MKTIRVVLMWTVVAFAALAIGCASSKPPLPSVVPEVVQADDEVRQSIADQSVAVPEASWVGEDALATLSREWGIVYFDYDDAQIRADQIDALSANVTKLKTAQDAKLTLAGHCDERGTIEYNLALGQRRANSAKAFLVRAGVQPERLNLVSYGEQQPADPGHTEAAWARNRRVEFTSQR